SRSASGTLVIGTMAFAALASQARSARAATITVNGSCSLSQAVTAVDSQRRVGGCAAGTGGDTIVLPAGTTTNVSSTLTITRSVTVQSSDPNVNSNIFTAHGSFLTQLFLIEPIAGTTASVTFTHIEFSDTNTVATAIVAVGANRNDKLTLNACIVDGFGKGGVFAQEMSVTVNETFFTSNSANLGAGLFFSGTGTNMVLVVSNSLFDSNATTAGGAGGALYYNGPAHSTINNSTFNQNSSDSGGALALFGSGIVDINGSTIANNLASGEGAGGTSTATVNFNLTLLAANAINQNPALPSDWDYHSTINSLTDSLLASQSSFGGFGDQGTISINTLGSHSILNVDAQNGAVVDFDSFNLGGEIFSTPGALRLPATSPAVDAIPSNTTGLATDQRGFTRGIDVPGGVGSNTFDIGAIERDPNLQAENLFARTISNGALSTVSGIAGFQPSSSRKGIKFVPGSSGASSIVFHLPMYDGGGATNLILHVQSGPGCGTYEMSIGNILLPPTNFIPIGTQSFSSSTTKVVTMPAISLAPFDQVGFGADEVVDIKFRLVSKPANSNGQLVLDFITLQ
ncbi:MAG: hypothetical protein M3O46_05345, partial [Myxococcota bacterium]|nr:hypothetical protein [Myxococcota bacterium]